MQILFIGDHKQNCGPSNVNKQLIKNFTSEFKYLKSNFKIIKFFELLYKFLICDRIVISGVSKLGSILATIAKYTRKKTIYIMHGYAKYEMDFDFENKMFIDYKYEEIILDKVDLILTVSHKFKEFLNNYIPQYDYKVNVLYNGIDRLENCNRKEKKDKNYIIAIGGDRGLKNNSKLCETICKMKDVYLKIYGPLIKKENISSNLKCRFMGGINQEDLFEEYEKAYIFVLNSIFETFSLSVFEALQHGCNILVSNNIGAVEILELNEDDVIFDVNNENEIKRKIENLYLNPNNERILSKINFEMNSYKNRVKELAEFCKKI